MNTQEEVEKIFSRIILNIPKYGYYEEFIAGSQKLFRILKKVGHWNNQFKCCKVSFWIQTFVNLENRLIDGKEYSGFLIRFYDDRISQHVKS